VTFSRQLPLLAPRVLVVVACAASALGAASHAGITISLGIISIGEPTIVPAAIVEAIIALAFAYATYALLAARPLARKALEGCHYSDSGSGGRSFVVVDEAAEAVESLDWACAELRRRVWGSEAESAVGTLAVVVLEVLADEVGEVALVSDQDPVEALAADRADEPLGIGVRDRRSDWSQDRADPSLAKTVSKASVNFASRSRINNENRVS